jgi:hypothetical protein
MTLTRYILWYVVTFSHHTELHHITKSVHGPNKISQGHRFGNPCMYRYACVCVYTYKHKYALTDTEHGNIIFQYVHTPKYKNYDTERQNSLYLLLNTLSLSNRTLLGEGNRIKHIIPMIIFSISITYSWKFSDCLLCLAKSLYIHRSFKISCWHV